MIKLTDNLTSERCAAVCSSVVVAVMLRGALNALLCGAAARICDRGTVGLLLNALSGLLSHFAAIYILIRADGQNPRDALPISRSYPRLAPLKVCAAVLLVSVTEIASRLLLNALGVVDTQTPVIRSDGGAVFLIVYFTVTVFIPAIAEELLFRGAIQNALARFNPRFAIIAQAVMFALAHSDPRRFCYALCGGLVLGYYAAVTGSLRFPIIVHMANNALSFMLTAKVAEPFSTAAAYVYMTVIICVALCGIGGIIAHLYGKRDARLVRIGAIGRTSAAAALMSSPALLLWAAQIAAEIFLRH